MELPGTSEGKSRPTAIVARRLRSVDNDFVTHLREWIDLRKSSKALTRGDYRSVYYDDALYVFCRRYEDEQVYVVINYGQADVDVSSRENLSFLGDVRVPAMAGVCIRVDHGGP